MTVDIEGVEVSLKKKINKVNSNNSIKRTYSRFKLIVLIVTVPLEIMNGIYDKANKKHEDVTSCILWFNNYSSHTISLDIVFQLFHKI